MVIEEGATPGAQLYVKGLTPDITEETLEHTFARFGHITQVLIVRDKETQACKGFGFVTFESREDARDALKAMDKKELNGSEIHVEEAASRRSPSYRRGGGRGRGGWGGPSRGGGFRGRGGPPRGRGGSRFDSDRGSRYDSDRYEDRFESDRRDRGDRDYSRSDRGAPRMPRGSRFEGRGSGGGGSRFEGRGGSGGGSRFESSRDRFEQRGGDRPSYPRGGYGSPRGGGFRDSYGTRDGQREYNSREYRERSPIGRDSRQQSFSSSRDRNSLLPPPSRDRDPPSRRDSRGYGGGSDYRSGPPQSRDYQAPSGRDYGGGGGREYGSSNGRDYAPQSRDYAPPESRDYGGRSEYTGARYDSAPPRRSYDSAPSSRNFSDSGRSVFDSYGGGGYESSGPRSSSRSMGMDSRRDDRMRDGGMRRGPPPSRDFGGPPTKRPRGGPPRSPPMRRGESPPPRGLTFGGRGSSRGGRGGGRGRGGPPPRRY